MNNQINQEAADWFIELNTGACDLITRTQFDAWLRASPENVRAFLEMLPIWLDGAQLATDSKVTAQELIASALTANNVISMQPVQTPLLIAQGDAPPQRGHIWRWRRTLQAACLIGITVGAVALGIDLVRYPSYSTGVGEQHSMVLPDGTAIELNSRSKIRVRYSERERTVELSEGQVLFQVASDPKRPFIVRSGATRVMAVGTQFDVYRKDIGTVVTVLEGRIAVYAPAHLKVPASTADVATSESDLAGGTRESAARDSRRVIDHANQLLRAIENHRSAEGEDLAPVLVAAGRQITVTADALETSEHPNLAVATAWTQRELVFDRTPLREVAEQFNRYNERPLEVDTAAAGDFRVSGIFSSTDPAALLRFLREQPGMKVTESGRGIHISQSSTSAR